MNEARRQMLLVSLMLALLLAAAWWAWGRMDAAREAAAAATVATRRVGELSEAIRSLREQPTLAGKDELAETQLTVLLQRSAEAAGLDPETAIQSIRPQPDRRVEGSPYRQKNTQLRLQGVTLKGLTHFLHDLSARSGGLRVESLQLSGPQGEGVGATWTVDPLVLSYLVYDPQTPDRRRAAGR